MQRHTFILQSCLFLDYKAATTELFRNVLRFLICNPVLKIYNLSSIYLRHATWCLHYFTWSIKHGSLSLGGWFYCPKTNIKYAIFFSPFKEVRLSQSFKLCFFLNGLKTIFKKTHCTHLWIHSHHFLLSFVILTCWSLFVQYPQLFLDTFI